MLIPLAGCAPPNEFESEERELSSTDAGDGGTGAGDAGAFGRVGAHGMVLAGTPSAAFLSHIPMFRAPHDVQLVVAGRLEVKDGAPALPASFGTTSFTFLPDKLSLDALRMGALTEFQGTVFLGNFEHGGRPIASHVRFVVTRVVHQHVLDAESKAALKYVLFGSRASAYAVHRIAAAPSFDEVLHVELSDHAPSDDALASGVEVTVTTDGPIGATETAVSMTVDDVSFEITVKKTLSCLVGPDFFDVCPDGT